jgi:hypothetical protein
VNANVSAPAPTFVGSAFFPSTAITQSSFPLRTYRAQPILLWLGAIIALAVLGRRRLRGWSWHTDLVVLLGAGGALAAATSGALIIQASPDGVGRESTGVAVLLVASCVVLVASGLGRLGPATSTDRQLPPPSAGPAPSAPAAADVDAAGGGTEAAGPHQAQQNRHVG